MEGRVVDDDVRRPVKSNSSPIKNGGGDAGGEGDSGVALDDTFPVPDTDCSLNPESADQDLEGGWNRGEELDVTPPGVEQHEDDFTIFHCVSYLGASTIRVSSMITCFIN